VYKFTVTVQTENKLCLMAHARKKVSDGPEFFLVLLMQIIITLCVCVCVKQVFLLYILSKYTHL
jgi:hypothetical protein